MRASIALVLALAAAATYAEDLHRLNCDGGIVGLCPTIRACPGDVGQRQIGYTCGGGSSPAYQCCLAGECFDQVKHPYLACRVERDDNEEPPDNPPDPPDPPEPEPEPEPEPDVLESARPRDFWLWVLLE